MMCDYISGEHTFCTNVPDTNLTVKALFPTKNNQLLIAKMKIWKKRV